MFSSSKVFALIAAVSAATSVQAYTGDATWYNVGLGACGITNNDNQLVAAVASPIYDNYPGHTANPNNNPICKHTATVHWGGKSVTVQIVDKCPGCGSQGIDLSPAAFQKLAALSVGRLTGATWSIN